MNTHDPEARAFWVEVRRGLLMVVRAIEYHWQLPRSSEQTLGATPHPEAAPKSESPHSVAPARSSPERVG